jgi:hypothetical protein
MSHATSSYLNQPPRTQAQALDQRIEALLLALGCLRLSHAARKELAAEITLLGKERAALVGCESGAVGF